MAETPCSDFVRADETPGDQYCECGRTLEEHDTAAPPPPATDPHEPKVRMELQTVHGELRFVPVGDHDGWTPLVPGCAMPERPMPVLVSVEVEDDDEPWAYTSSGAYWSAADCEVFTTDRDEAFYSTERFRIKRDRDEPAKRLTAWRPAPEPYRGR